MKITPKVAIAGAAVLTAVVITAGFVLAHDTKPTVSYVKGSSTAAQKPKQTDTPAENNVSAAASPTTANNPTATPRPAASATTTTATAPNTNKTTAQPSISSPTPAPTSAPTPAPTPAPQPSFRIVLRTAEATDYQSFYNPGVMQRIVPFDIVYDAGFAQVNYQQPGCLILSTPVPGQSNYCDLHQKEPHTGSLVFQYSDASARGHYKIQAIYPINGVTKTAIYEFDL